MCVVYSTDSVLPYDEPSVPDEPSMLSADVPRQGDVNIEKASFSDKLRDDADFKPAASDDISSYAEPDEPDADTAAVTSTDKADDHPDVDMEAVSSTDKSDECCDAVTEAISCADQSLENGSRPAVFDDHTSPYAEPDEPDLSSADMPLEEGDNRETIGSCDVLLQDGDVDTEAASSTENPREDDPSVCDDCVSSYAIPDEPDDAIKEQVTSTDARDKPHDVVMESKQDEPCEDVDVDGETVACDQLSTDAEMTASHCDAVAVCASLSTQDEVKVEKSVTADSDVACAGDGDKDSDTKDVDEKMLKDEGMSCGEELKAGGDGV